MEAAGAVPRQPPVAPAPPGLSPLAVANDVLPPKRQAVVDRLRRRIESYRRRQSDCMPRFDQSFTGLCEQNLQDTLALKQRFLETKAKRQAKTKDKKQTDNTTTALQSSIHVQQKFLKRTSEELDSTGQPSDSNHFEPPVKLQCTQQHQNEVHKFSVEIVQQLEFTTSAANSQPQQISTNVTVKALTNTSVKSDVSSPKSSNPSTPSASNINRPNNTNSASSNNNNSSNNNSNNSGIGCVDIGTLVECKQEPDNDFADLDQCAAALEKDAAANGGTNFAGISDLIGDDTNDEIITPDDFKSLISEISDYPEFMKDFDFEDKSVVSDNILPTNGLKVEESKEQICQQILGDGQVNKTNTQSPLLQQNSQYSPPVFEGQAMQQKNRMLYPNMDLNKSELSPAAQTLKQMAEQHQHKNQMGLNFNPNSNRTPNARSPYTDFQFQGDYVGSPNSTGSTPVYHKQNTSFPQPDMIKQEMIFQQNEFDMQKRKTTGIYKQQYSPYGSPSASGHGSPGYLPPGRGGNTNTGSNTPGGGTPGSGAPFSGGTPPRPPSGPGNTTSATLQINQAQQLHISQQGHGHSIQVSAGQHLHLSGDLKGNVSVAQQQGMYFNHQQAQQNNTHQPPNQNAQQSQPQQNQQGLQHQAQPGPQHMPQTPNHDSYSVSQSQTINFTQQTLRQRAGPTNPGMTNTMATGMAGQRTINPQALEQQKLLQQQQLLRAQQQMQQQQHMIGMNRPPPPDYKTSAGMMHGMQPRYAGQAPTMRRMPHQPMPPSGPMMRPHNMYMMSQQHITRGMYPRQQNAMAGTVAESIPQHNTEWRHLVMNQQQNANFNPQMRPNFQQGYAIGNAGGVNMSVLQHQQMRAQGMVTNTMQQNPMAQNQGGMTQAGNMGNMGSQQLNMPINQQMLSHVQQQTLIQQNSSQMSMAGIHMSQSQSLSISNQSLHQTQMNSQPMVTNQSNNQSNALSSYGQQTPDFSLENLLSADTSNFTEQELLNSFDSDSGFNLQDIL